MTAGTDVESRVGLFPGQGGYRRGVLHASWASGDPSVHEVFDAVDAAAGDILRKTVSARIFGGGSPTPEDLFTEDPELLQLAIFGISVSVYRLLRTRGAEFTVLLGHSLGEIGALVCAGAFSVQDGAEMICHRIAATSRVGGSSGGLTALICDPTRATQLLELVGQPDLVVAVVNGPSHVVVAGPSAGLRVVETVAAAVGITAVRLLAPAPFHSPLMSAVRNEVVRRVPAYPRRLLEVPVYSPILGRFYRDADDLVELLGLHLVTPVHFGPAVARLHGSGARTFVEVGAGGTLTGLARAAFPDITVRAPLSGIDEAAALDDTAAYLRDPVAATAPSRRSPAPPTMPPAAERTAPTAVATPPPAPAPPPASTPVVPPAPVPAPAPPPASTPVVPSAPEPPPPAGPEPSATSTAPPRPPDASATSTAPPHPPEAPATSTAPPHPAATAAPSAGDDDLAATIRRIYAEALEYPEDVLTDDAHLEADLGIDSVMRTELLALLNDRFELGPPPEDFRASDYETFGSVVRLMRESANGGRLVAR